MTSLSHLGHPLTLRPDAEALQVIFDPEKVSFRQLVEFFYRMHDPTTLNSQGPDMGTQYRSAIFFHDDEQEKIAKDITEKVQKEWWKKKITTEIVPAGEEFLRFRAVEVGKMVAQASACVVTSTISSGYDGAGGRSRTCDLRIMRPSL